MRNNIILSMANENGISDRNAMKNLIYNLENEDLDNFLDCMRAEGHLNPLLLAAEYGCHKILKKIVGLDEDQLRLMETREGGQQFSLDDCNENGENILHLGELSISHN